MLLIGLLFGCLAAVNVISAGLLPSKRIQFISMADCEKERVPIDNPDDARAVKSAYLAVDRYLRGKVDTSNFDENMKKIKSLLKKEVRTKYRNMYFNSRKPTSHSEDLDKEIMINALLRLKDLEMVEDEHSVCKDFVTEIIIENNKFTKNAIDRLYKFRRSMPGGHVVMPRVDYLIVEAARRQAHKCDLYFASKIKSGQEELSVVVDHFNTLVEQLKRTKAAEVDETDKVDE